MPGNRARRAALAHVSPLERPRPHRRGRLRPKVAARQPRAIRDPQWEELFAQMGCARDRALLACYVSSGARASELLGVRLADVDWHDGKLWVVSKGTRLRQPVPVSAEALAYLAGYLDEAGLPEEGGSVWRTRRGLSRSLTYWAARRIIQRAAERLGMNWTLHDLRHTAASRMARDLALTLPEVQTILRHAHVTTTALYTVTGLDDLIDKLAGHFQRPAQPVRWSAAPPPTAQPLRRADSSRAATRPSWRTGPLASAGRGNWPDGAPSPRMSRSATPMTACWPSWTNSSGTVASGTRHCATDPTRTRQTST